MRECCFAEPRPPVLCFIVESCIFCFVFICQRNSYAFEALQIILVIVITRVIIFS